MSDTDDPTVEAPNDGLASMLDGLEEMEAEQKPARKASAEKTADDLEAVFDVPVRISAVLGRTKMAVSDLLEMDAGSVVELDRQVGEAIDIYVNQRLVARGEIVLVEDKLGITMTEIIKAG
ncbi:flagellar motor switch protein FliN [Maritalea sp.]|jgi:flagellar motor switch protein FliN/FliY|uniref:flagellar motor switch protein FliN n=1 Tax=Maritalea sp. TaxID=2003361 RepID=UPI0039E48B27